MRALGLTHPACWGSEVHQQVRFGGPSDRIWCHPLVMFPSLALGACRLVRHAAYFVSLRRSGREGQGRESAYLP